MRISKRILQENKACQIFPNISYPLIHTHACAYLGLRNVRFVSCNTRFEIRLFALLPSSYDFYSKYYKLRQSFLEKVATCTSSNPFGLIFLMNIAPNTLAVAIKALVNIACF